MIKKFMCWIWGHRITSRVITGNCIKMTNHLTGQETSEPLYKWEQFEFCTQCGEINKQYTKWKEMQKLKA